MNQEHIEKVNSLVQEQIELLEMIKESEHPIITAKVINKKIFLLSLKIEQIVNGIDSVREFGEIINQSQKL